MAWDVANVMMAECHVNPCLDVYETNGVLPSLNVVLSQSLRRISGIAHESVIADRLSVVIPLRASDNIH